MTRTMKLSEVRPGRYLVSDSGDIRTAEELIELVKQGKPEQWQKWTTTHADIVIEIDVAEVKI